MEQLFQALSFLATETGIVIISVVVSAMILLWEWRATLIGLVLVQTGVITLAVVHTGLPAQWAGLQLVIMIIIAIMLAISVVQTPASRSLRQAGNWLLRLMAVTLIFLAWRILDITIPVPGVAPELVAFFTWLALAMLLMLGLSDNPLFTGVALLLWFMPAQVVIAAQLPDPTLFAVIAGLELLIALAASYLILADPTPQATQRLVMTDIVFPDQLEDALAPTDGLGATNEFDGAAPLPGFLQGIVDRINGNLGEPGPGTQSTEHVQTEERI